MVKVSHDHDAIMADYHAGLKVNDIASRNNCNVSLIYKVLRKRSLPSTKMKMSRKIDHDALISDYFANMDIYDIARKYDCAQQTIYRIIHKYEYDARGRDYMNCHEEFFDNIDTEEKAYWLGFIVADGCIYERSDNSMYLSIGLASFDLEHLVKFRNTIGSENVFKHRDMISEKSGNELHSDTFALANQHLVTTLRSYGVTPRKSCVMKPIGIPEVIPYELERHYWRGLVDGDGCLSIDKQNILSICLCGTYGIVDQFLNYTRKFSSHCIRNPWLAYPGGLTYNIDIGDVKGNGIIVARELYHDSIIFLERKKQILEQYLGESV